MCQIEKKKEDFCILTIPHSHSLSELCNYMQKNKKNKPQKKPPKLP